MGGRVGGYRFTPPPIGRGEAWSESLIVHTQNVLATMPRPYRMFRMGAINAGDYSPIA